MPVKDKNDDDQIGVILYFKRIVYSFPHRNANGICVQGWNTLVMYCMQFTTPPREYCFTSSKYIHNRPFPPTFAIQREREKLRYWVGFFGVLSSPLKTAFGTIGNGRLRSH